MSACVGDVQDEDENAEKKDCQYAKEGELLTDEECEARKKQKMLQARKYALIALTLLVAFLFLSATGFVVAYILVCGPAG